MINIPTLNLGIVAVSPDCFPLSLSQQRRNKVVGYCAEKDIQITELETIIENENDVVTALAEAKERNINSLVIYPRIQLRSATLSNIKLPMPFL